MSSRESPVQNAHVESCHGKLREECLNASWFQNLWAVRRKIEAWRKEYNEERPAQQFGIPDTCGLRTPKAAREMGCGKDGGFATLENASRFRLSHSLDGGGLSRHCPVLVSDGKPPASYVRAKTLRT